MSKPTAMMIAKELDVENVVVNHTRQTYRVVGESEVSNFDEIEGYAPIPDGYSEE